MLRQLDHLQERVREFDQRLTALLKVTPEMQLLATLPGVGSILAGTMALEMGTIERFLSAERLASYSGAAPRVQASGGHEGT
jgi:transposase